MISIINYGCGNLLSIQNMLKSIGAESIIINSPEQLANADKIILPGVGSFDTGMRSLADGGWIDKLNVHAFEKKTPILGICLGMQLITKGSEEGNLPGLGWIDAETIRFNFQGTDQEELRVPHMGWNIVRPVKTSALFDCNDEELRFYHVHSFYVKMAMPEEETAQTKYGFNFTSAFQRDNIYGVQFHPEKSHRFGKSLLKRFVAI